MIIFLRVRTSVFLFDSLHLSVFISFFPFFSVSHDHRQGSHWIRCFNMDAPDFVQSLVTTILSLCLSLLVTHKSSLCFCVCLSVFLCLSLLLSRCLICSLVQHGRGDFVRSLLMTLSLLVTMDALCSYFCIFLLCPFSAR